MPVYEYACQRCGVFSMLRSMNESNEQACCTQCGNPSERIISVPHLAILGKAQRAAHEVNEKAAHEPKATRRSSCGCSGSHTCKTAGAKAKSSETSGASRNTGLHMQTKKTARPWMLGH